jgi:hypothetical protein
MHLHLREIHAFFALRAREPRWGLGRDTGAGTFGDEGGTVP